MPSKTSVRLGALTVAAVCSTVVTLVVIPSSAQADPVRIHDIQGTTRLSPARG